MPKLVICGTCRQWFHASATRVTDVMGENEPVCLSCLAQIAARSSEPTPSSEGAAPASSPPWATLAWKEWIERQLLDIETGLRLRQVDLEGRIRRLEQSARPEGSSGGLLLDVLVDGLWKRLCMSCRANLREMREQFPLMETTSGSSKSTPSTAGASEATAPDFSTPLPTSE